MEEKDLESNVDDSFNSSANSSTIREFATITSHQPHNTQSILSETSSSFLSDRPEENNDFSVTEQDRLEQTTAPNEDSSHSDIFQKLSYYLRINGFDVLDPIIEASILKRVVEETEIPSWLQKVMGAIVDQNDRLQKFQKYVLAIAGKDSQTRSSESLKMAELEKRLGQSKQKEELLQRKIHEYETASLNSSFGSQTASHASVNSSQQVRALQLKVKALESLLKESERRQKQRETEFERLRSKLSDFVEKERKEQVKHSQTLKKLEGKEKILLSLFASSGFLSDSSTKDKAMQDIAQLFVALEKQRKQLKQQNEDLQLQVDKLSRAKAIQEMEKHAPATSSSRKDPLVLTISPTDTEERRAEERLAQQTIEELQETIIQQKIDLDYQAKKLRLLALEREEEQKRFLQSQQSINSLQQSIENLQIELKSRPTVKQWHQAQRDIADLEKIAHNVSVARDEADELSEWKKHLSSRDQMRIDKRNHDLHLWLVESLPKSYLKETMQAVCRELDVSDVSEVLQNLQKLKTVVRTVPRMEELLSNISAYVFERNGQLSEILGLAATSERDLTLDSVLAILRRWWMIIQRCIELEDFRLAVLFELFRREQLLFSSASRSPLAGNEDLIREKWKEPVGVKQWISKDKGEVFDGLRASIEFETKLMSASLSSQDYEQYLRQRPDIVSNRILQYLQSLFEVPSVEQVLPVAQQLFLQKQQFQQFLEISRKLLGKPKDLAVEVVVSEVLEKLQTVRS